MDGLSEYDYFGMACKKPRSRFNRNVWEMLAQLVYDGPEITKEAQLWERKLGAKND